MSRTAQRVQLARAYVLHRRPFRDSSLIVEILAREFGRMSVFARAARGPGTRCSLLQPFRPLLLSWSGRGESPQLTAVESSEDRYRPLPAAQFLSGCYLNELLMTLTTRHDPCPELFDAYAVTLDRLAQGGLAEACLRGFEARLLELIGYGLNLVTEADTGEPIRPEAHYRYRPGVHGLVRSGADDEGAVPGHVLACLAGPGALSGESELRSARMLMRAAIDHCLDGRQLRTRGVARSLAVFPRKERNVG